MKKLAVFILFILVFSGTVFGQTEINLINELINYLDKPVPSGAMRVNRSEYSREISSTEIYSVYEVFEVLENNVIMAANKIIGYNNFVNGFYGQLFTTFEPLGVPIAETRNSAVWINKEYIIIITLSDIDRLSSSVIIYVLTVNNFDLFQRIMGI